MLPPAKKAVMRFILAGSLLAGLNGRSVISSPEMAMRDPGQGGRHRQTSAMVDAGAHRRMWRCELEVGGHRRRPGAIVGNGDAAARRARLCVVSASSDAAMLERGEKTALGVSEAASLHAVQGGRNRAGDQEENRAA